GGFIFTRCTLLQPVRDPIERIIRKGSCISIDIPPITLTPARTAAERQLIGEEGEVEEDGWLIASSQSTSEYDGVSGGQAVEGQGTMTALRRYHVETGVIEFYNEPVREYRAARVLGEGYDGRLHPVPAEVAPRQGRYRNPEEMAIAAQIASEVNRAREWLYSYHSQNAPADQSEDIEKKYLRRFYLEARSGEWVLDENNRWLRVR
ncbi:MAG: DUF1318 domain-containing protein, partial [Leptospiraceae bacterium]|nr:DUF1318 domain-containing protein [Leptospiraceae bacterium]